MADVHHFRRRCEPKIEALRRSIESTCRTYDKGITSCIWLLCILLVWFVLSSTVMSPSTLLYQQTNISAKADLYVASGRRQQRTLHRVIGMLEDTCSNADAPDVALGPHVHVNGKPYMTRVLRVCAAGVTLLNPYVAVTGSRSGKCIDEIDGRVRTVSRAYPLTLHSDSREPYTLMQLDEVCSVMQALDMLDGIW